MASEPGAKECRVGGDEGSEEEQTPQGSVSPKQPGGEEL